MIKKIFLLFLLCTISVAANAQYRWRCKIFQCSAVNNYKDSLPGVLVSIPQFGIYRYADANGIAEFSSLPSIDFTVFLNKEGYVTKEILVQVDDYNKLKKFCMEPISMESKEVVISGIVPSLAENSAMNISTVTIDELHNSDAISLVDGLSRQPGISQMVSGNSISKPVIRGMHGNRILVLVNGLRFDNQQWQDEHGLGVTDVGLEHIEIIKGPASFLYGSDAMAGVINLVNEKPAVSGEKIGNFSSRFFGNTQGTALSGGYKTATDNKQWNVFMSSESHADYTDGNGKRVLNSRFNGVTLKAGVAWVKPNRTSSLNFNSSYYSFGFTPIAKIDDFVADSRSSRTMQGPHHSINYNILTFNNTYFQGDYRIKWDAGIHVNNRQEQEYGNRIALNMLMNSIENNVRLITQLGSSAELSVGSAQYIKTNRNYGSNVIVPDANIYNASVYGFVRDFLLLNKLKLEGGMRYDFTQTDVLYTSLNAVELAPFQRIFHAGNISMGLNYHATKQLIFKGNLASGFRTPNLAELASNGVHEGTLRWEIGNHIMQQEVSFSLDAGAKYTSKYLSVEFNVFSNSINNYIYLSHTKDSMYAFRIYKYLQQDAELKGFETAIDFKPEFAEWFDVNTSYTYLDARLHKGGNIPLTPANKINSTVKIEFKKTFVKAGIDYVLAQNRPADLETSTPAYYLINAGVGGDFNFRNHPFKLSLMGSNLLNKVYYDHLSLLKPVGIYNMGRNIVLNLTIPLTK
ncbi:MAG: TonB-dependent receptor [Bacteroidetes bacterium]|nr:TonB-dependent receptor [Bacteroidota bacterium]